MVRKSLVERQVDMRARQSRGRRGRKKRVSRREKLRRRIRSRFFVLEGRTPEWIAAFFRVNPEAVRRWIRRGMPLVDAQAPKKQTEPTEYEPYYRFS